VLEHLASPASALQEIRRLLKPAGKLIAHVPWDREWRHSKYEPHEPNHHLYTWNAQSLGNLLILQGFTINEIRVQRYGYDRISANLAAGLGFGESGFKVVRKVITFFRPLYEIEAVCIR
jgi:SAM-dependent methyltransferase